MGGLPRLSCAAWVAVQNLGEGAEPEYSISGEISGTAFALTLSSVRKGR